ncbi:MAG: hypothetical protein QOK30_3354 [Nocardioidaceae bacterium]|nr:hypothetical protein [Nocardioidaceae bacterium]
MADRTRLAALVVAWILLGPMAAGAWASPPSGPAAVASGDAIRRHVAFSISSPLITESSSLVVSTVHPGLLYTANDSGDSATVYVLDASDGSLVGRTTLSGVTAVDVESMAIGTDGTLVVGDIGDNTGVRSGVALYRIPQPARGDVSVVPETVALTYPGGPRDAESLLYDALSGRVFVASKLLGGAKVYRSPPDVFSRRHALLQPIANAPPLATDATFVDGHRYAMIRSYFSAVMYRFPTWHRMDSFDLPLQPQGESVAALPGTRTVLLGSEGDDSKVLRFRLPDLAVSRPSGSSTASTPGTVIVSRPESAATSRHRDRLRSVAKAAIGVAAVGVVAVLLVGLVQHRRRTQ